jgi:hypothetical protein
MRLLYICPKRKEELLEFLETTDLFDKPRRSLFGKGLKADIPIPTVGAVMQTLESLGASLELSGRQHRQVLYDTMRKSAIVIAMLKQKPTLRAEVRQRLVKLRQQEGRATKFDLDTEIVVIATGNTGKARKLANKRARVICHLLSEGVDPDEIALIVRKRGLEEIYRASVPKLKQRPRKKAENGDDGEVLTFSARIAKSDSDKLVEECRIGEQATLEVHRVGQGSSDFKITGIVIRGRGAGDTSKDWAA